MINREDSIELIETLSGDEHSWVDSKRDYYVLGLENKKAEFVKDVAAMANTPSERDEHYIFIGVSDDSGNLTGVHSEYADGSDPQHILAVDEANLQKVISEYLSPSPNVTLYKFTDQDPKFGVLKINQLERKPTVIQKSIDFQGERKLHKGLIFYRSGSSNTIALRSDLEKFIDSRIQRRRDEILEGIKLATEIGPEAVASVGDLVYEESEGDIQVEVGEEGDFILEERFSREPISDLDERLTLDIKRWATTESVEVDSTTLWKYYAKSDQLTIDEQSVLFLTQASLKNNVYGAFWLTYIDIDKISDVLKSSIGDYHKNIRKSHILAGLGLCGDLEDFYSGLSTDTSFGIFEDILSSCGKTPSNRLTGLTKNTEYDIGYRSWNGQFDVSQMEEEDLREIVHTLSDQLIKLEEKVEGYGKWSSKRDEFRDALKDAELALLIRTST